MRYAIVENGVVTNIIELDPKNADEFPSAVPIGDVSAGISDTYSDGVYFRDGERLLTPLETADATIAALDAAVLDLEYANAMMALGL